MTTAEQAWEEYLAWAGDPMDRGDFLMAYTLGRIDEAARTHAGVGAPAEGTPEEREAAPDGTGGSDQGVPPGSQGRDAGGGGAGAA